MKKKLYTNKHIIPRIIDIYDIDGQQVLHINKKIIIATEYEIPLYLKLHFLMHQQYGYISRAYVQVLQHYAPIKISPNYIELTQKCRKHKLKITNKGLLSSNEKPPS